MPNLFYKLMKNPWFSGTWFEKQSKETNIQKKNKQNWRIKEKLARWSPIEFAKSPKGQFLHLKSSVPALREETKLVTIMSSRRVAEWFCDAVIYHRKLQNPRMPKDQVKKWWTISKGSSLSGSESPTYFIECVFVANV